MTSISRLDFEIFWKTFVSRQDQAISSSNCVTILMWVGSSPYPAIRSKIKLSGSIFLAEFSKHP